MTATDPRRRATAEAVARELAERSDIEAVLLHGSTVRGEALAGSDIDLLVVTATDDVPIERFTSCDGFVVDTVAHRTGDWLERLERPRPMWVYAFLEAELLVDTGPGSEVVEAARHRYQTYRTPEAVKAELADALWHGRAKLVQAEQSTDDALAGYWGSVYLVHGIVEMLYAVADRPLPPGSRRFDLVGDLPLTERHRELFGELCAGSARRRITAAVCLVEELAPGLGPPPHRPT